MSFRRLGSAPVRAFTPVVRTSRKRRTGCRLGPALIIVEPMTPVAPMDFCSGSGDGSRSGPSPGSGTPSASGGMAADSSRICSRSAGPSGPRRQAS